MSQVMTPQDAERQRAAKIAEARSRLTVDDYNRVSFGNNVWKESNMRQWLNSSGNDWFQKQNEYDIKSKNPEYGSGWMTDFVPGFLELVMPVYNKTARNTVSAIDGGGGGGYDITLDRFWLLSITEFDGTIFNGIAEGKQLSYFSEVATTNEQRIQYGEDGVAVGSRLRSSVFSLVNSAFLILTNGTAYYNDGQVSNRFAFQPVMCL